MHAFALVAMLVNGAVVAGQGPLPAGYLPTTKDSPIVPRDPKAAPGMLKGRASDGLTRPYTDYVVIVRDVQTGVVLGQQAMDAEGNFQFEGLAPHRFVVLELKNIRKGGVIWTGGPYVLSAERATTLTVSVGPASNTASWVMRTAAEVPSVIPLAIRSGSR